MPHRIFLIIESLLIVFLGIELQTEAQAQQLRKCLFVASYHQGYAWQDGLERGLRSVLEGKCEIRQFNMDTKRNPSPAFCRHKALEAKALIESWKPEFVIASDDNASKYLVAPYFKNKELPFVFCGINWTAEKYGYPYSNATGMIESSPIRTLLRYLEQILPDAKALVNNSIIHDWDEIRAKQIVFNHSEKLTVTINKWMTPYAMLGLTTVPEEQGEYAAAVALIILAGAQPGDIPVITNRQWNTYVNKPLLKKVGIRLPAGILKQAEKV